MRTLMSDWDSLNDLFINKCEILPSVEDEEIIQNLNETFYLRFLYKIIQNVQNYFNRNILR